jgi:hypothetical protein
MLSQIFAQDGPESVFAINVGYLLPSVNSKLNIGLGFWYERYLNDYFSVGGDIGVGFTLYESGYKTIYPSIRPQIRFYPFATSTAGFFTGLSAGYTFAYYMLDKDVIGHWFNVNPLIGYKLIINDSFLLEPSIGYNIRHLIIDPDYEFSYTNGIDSFSTGNISWGIILGFGSF